MLQANRSTFKPSGATCITRADTAAGLSASFGFGCLSDAGFSADDNFDVANNSGVTIYNQSSTAAKLIPKETQILRIYVSPEGLTAACLTIEDPCDTGPQQCPSGSDCCCTEQGICCDRRKVGGSCEKDVCLEDCQEDYHCFLPNEGGTPYTEEERESICAFCGKCACCDPESGGFCRCVEDGEPENPDYGLCFAVSCSNNDGPGSCETHLETCGSGGTSWACLDTTGGDPCSSDCGGTCTEIAGDGGYPTKEDCDIACKAEADWYCCGPDVGCKSTSNGGAVCTGGGPYCSQAACEQCNSNKCSQAPTGFDRQAASTYASATIPTYTTKTKGSNLSFDEAKILNRNSPFAVAVSNISQSQSEAYNARLLHASLLPTTTEVLEPADTRAIAQASGGAFCDPCAALDRVDPDPIRVNCGSVQPAMAIYEYDISNLSSVCDDVSLIVFREVDTSETSEYFGQEIYTVLLATYLTESPTPVTRFLLGDIFTGGKIVNTSTQGTIDCDTCGITFDCSNTQLTEGEYLTFTETLSTYASSKLEGFLGANVSEQTGFSTSGGRLLNQRVTTHNISVSEKDINQVEITTKIVSVNSNLDVYSGSATDDEKLISIIGGSADHESARSRTIATQLVWDPERADSELAGNTYISGNDSGTLQCKYGLAGFGDCTLDDSELNENSGPALFAAVAGNNSLAPYTTGDDSGDSVCEDPDSEGCQYVFTAFSGGDIPDADNDDWVLNCFNRDGNGSDHALATEIGLSNITFKKGIVGPVSPPYLTFSSAGLAAKFMELSKGIKFTPIGDTVSEYSPITIPNSDLSISGTFLNAVLINYTQNTGDLAADIANPETPALPDGGLVPVRVELV